MAIQSAIDPLDQYRNDDMSLASYAWPGGYPIVYVTADGGVLCPDCANGKGGSEATTDPDATSDWQLVAADIHWEGSPEVCDHCGAEIESAYGETDDE